MREIKVQLGLLKLHPPTRQNQVFELHHYDGNSTKMIKLVTERVDDGYRWVVAHSDFLTIVSSEEETTDLTDDFTPGFSP